MLEYGDTSNDGARELIARLAAAVMIADGRVSESELCAVDHLRDLELGSLAAFVDAEVERAVRVPINVAHTAAALAEMAPDGGAIIVSALAQIASSDRELSRREVEVLGLVASVLGLSSMETALAIRSAATSYRAGIAEQPPPAAAKSPQEPVSGSGIEDSSVPEPPRTREPLAATPPPPRGTPADLEWALPVLGLTAGASADEANAAYATLIRRYNPAGVIELGPEFAVLAVQRLSAVTAAYLAARQALGGPH